MKSYWEIKLYLFNEFKRLNKLKGQNELMLMIKSNVLVWIKVIDKIRLSGMNYNMKLNHAIRMSKWW